MNEHELFERAIAAHSGREHFPRSQHHDGYARPADQNMWIGWQLARSMAPLPVDLAPQREFVLLVGDNLSNHSCGPGIDIGVIDKGFAWLDHGTEVPDDGQKVTGWLPLPRVALGAKTE
ncbi:MAG TPA: hypothetical protein VFM34_11230 [Moraxellaceae bacterium]|nr:hypothetical protein [Moraxellaceae bacterium]